MSDEGKAEGHDVEYDIDHGLDVLVKKSSNI
jgi:hypothetical protein